MRYKHYIITRFNLSNKWNLDKRGVVVLDKEWLIDRYNLFESYCYPSVLSQSCNNFEWWVYFDQKINHVFKEKNKSFQKMTPKYELSYDDFEKNMPYDVWKDALKHDLDCVITTRLDNDDILAKDTIAVLQSKLKVEDYLLEIPSGYTLELGDVPKLRLFNWKLNPFISLVEKIDKKSCIKSIYSNQHGQWSSTKSIIASHNPQWIQVIHNKNIINSIKGEEVLPFGLKRRFVFKMPVFNKNQNIYLIKKLIKKKIKSFFE